MLFIDGPRQIPSVISRMPPPYHKNTKRVARKDSKTPRSLSLGESPSIEDNERADEVPMTRRNEIKVEESALQPTAGGYKRNFVLQEAVAGEP